MKKLSSQILVVLVTTATQEEASKIARAMVRAKLAACANILPTIHSVYRWKRKIVKEKEVLLILKTMAPRYPALEKKIKAMHSYEIPEILAMPVLGGFAPYIGWVHKETHP